VTTPSPSPQLPAEPSRSEKVDAYEILGVVLALAGAAAFMMSVGAYMHYYGMIAGTLLRLIVAGFFGGPAMALAGVILYVARRLTAAARVDDALPRGKRE